MLFTEQLLAATRDHNSLLCVGLDPDPAKFPAHLKNDATRIYDFCAAIVDATADLACAFKPQIAYFAAHRAEDQLERLMAHIQRNAPKVPVILDAKRGDIASTAEAYARSAFRVLGAHAVTLSPYLGRDSIEPFLADPEKGAFLLCKTSNPGAADLQDLALAANNEPLYLAVARLARDWNTSNNVGLVVGATQPEALARVRQAAPELWILAPGIGAQGGELETALLAGLRTDGRGLLLPVSRAISRASDPGKAAAELRDRIIDIQYRHGSTRK